MSTPILASNAARIDGEHRNGSITAIGIVLGFSLSFLAAWSLGPDRWEWPGVAIVLLLGIGIGLQIRALRQLLRLAEEGPPDCTVRKHNEAVGWFVTGMICVAAAFAAVVAIGVLHDLFGIRI